MKIVHGGGADWFQKMAIACLIFLFVLVGLLPEFLRLLVYAVKELAPYFIGFVLICLGVVIILRLIGMKVKKPR